MKTQLHSSTERNPSVDKINPICLWVKIQWRVTLNVLSPFLEVHIFRESIWVLGHHCKGSKVIRVKTNTGSKILENHFFLFFSTLGGQLFKGLKTFKGTKNKIPTIFKNLN